MLDHLSPLQPKTSKKKVHFNVYRLRTVTTDNFIDPARTSAFQNVLVHVTILDIEINYSRRWLGLQVLYSIADAQQ